MQNIIKRFSAFAAVFLSANISTSLADTYSELSATVAATSQMRLKLEADMQVFAAEKRSAADLQKVYENLLKKKTEQLRRLREKNESIKNREKTILEKIESDKLALETLDKFVSEKLAEITSDSVAKKTLEENSEIPSAAAIAKMRTSEKYKLLSSIFEILKQRDAQIEISNGITSTGLWACAKTTSKKLADGVYEAEISYKKKSLGGKVENEK